MIDPRPVTARHDPESDVLYVSRAPALTCRESPHDVGLLLGSGVDGAPALAVISGASWLTPEGWGAHAGRADLDAGLRAAADAWVAWRAFAAGAEARPLGRAAYSSDSDVGQGSSTPSRIRPAPKSPPPR